MKRNLFMRSLLTALFAVLGASTLAFGQGVTGSALNGRVIDQTGKPLENVAITALHGPTGTTYSTLTRPDGRFNIPGVRVGGPYTITAKLIGYHEQKADGIRLTLGENRRLSFTLVESAIELQAINVTAEKNEILSANRTGAETHISEQEIDDLPSIARSIQDFARLSPQVVGTNIGNSDNTGGSSIGGNNNRFNNIQIDGAILNDVFGLAASGTPGGQANVQPISLDAIQEFQVAIAPYDVRQGGFTGGSINAVTRSGTNKWKASGFFFGRDQDFVGDLINLDGTPNPIARFHQIQTGGRIGGPLVKDKVFLFFTGEAENRDRPIQVGLAGSGAPTVNPNTVSDVQRVISIAQQQYGFNAGTANETLGRAQNNSKFFTRLDFNLSDQHHLKLRYNHVDASAERGISRSTREFGLDSQGYTFNSVQNSVVAQLDSRFTNSMSNMARFSYLRQRESRDSDLAPFPEVEIFAGPGGEAITLGTERFSQANALAQDVYEFTDDLSFYKGEHAITVGTHNEFFNFDNLFIQDFFGQYQFNSIDDFQAGLPSRFRHSFSTTGNQFQTANWSAYQLGGYVQDEFQATPNIKLTIGVRADVPILPDDPGSNPAFSASFPGLDTNAVPSGNVLFSPRAGFNIDVTGNRTTQIRGGTGLFSGRNPFVWLSNQYSNNGITFGRIDQRPSSNPNLVFVPDPLNQPTTGPGVGTTTEINVTNPNFDFPQVFRSNLGIDQQIVPGLTATMDLLYTKNVNAILFRDLALVEAGTAFDGRKLFASGRPIDPTFTDVFELNSVSQGHQTQLTFQLQKQPSGFLPGLSGSLAYTYTDAQDVNSGQSSRSISNFQFNEAGIDPNNPDVGTSDFEILHRILANATYHLRYAHGFESALTIFYTGRSGRPFNWIYFGDANNDNFRFNDLIFVPGTANDAIFDLNRGGKPFSAWQSFMQSDAGLMAAAGGIVPKNTSREPWVNQLDLRFKQTIPSVQGHSLQLTLDIQNVINLLDSSKGLQKFARFQSKTIFSFRGYDSASGKPIVRFTQRDTNGDGVVTRDDIFSTDNILSRWAIQLGARYNFGF